MSEQLTHAPPDASKMYGHDFQSANIAFQAENFSNKSPETTGSVAYSAEHAGHVALDGVGVHSPETETNLEVYEGLLSEDERDMFAPADTPQDSKTADELADEIFGSVDDTKYDYLYDPEFEYASKNTEKAGVNFGDTGKLKVTEKGEQFSAEILSKIKDSSVLAIIKERATELKKDISAPTEIMKMIREDKETRFALAVTLLRKLDGLTESSTLAPDRVGRKDEKKSPARFYGNYRKTTMPSRDYVICVGLSFLDGSFEARKEDFNALTNGFDPKVGEHRFTAAGLLTNNWERPGEL